MKWFTYYPIDTIIVKNATPSEIGVNHFASSIFPPPPSTIEGAMRSALAIQTAQNNKTTLSFAEVHPEKLPFSIVGSLFMKDNDFFAPAPFSWFCEKTKNTQNENVTIAKGKKIKNDLIIEENELLFADLQCDEITSIGGKWVKLKDLYTTKNKLELYTASDFFAYESRVGIGRGLDRVSDGGKIYNFTHIRLLPNVLLVFGIDADANSKIHNLAEKGDLQLGAEQRFGYYQKITTEKEPQFKQNTKDTTEYMSLSISSGIAAEKMLATGKIQYFGGWDMAKRFHKQMVGYYPQGTVTTEKINNHFIAI